MDGPGNEPMAKKTRSLHLNFVKSYTVKRMNKIVYYIIFQNSDFLLETET